MIETLLGGAFRLPPEILEWIDRKGERTHELVIQDKTIHPSSTLTLKSKPFPANKSAYNAAYRGANSKPIVVARLNQ